MTTVGVTGHQDLPDAAVDFLRTRISMELKESPDVSVGVCSLAAGADQLFARQVLNAGVELSVIVPARDYENTFQEQNARREYRRLLNQAATVQVLDFAESSEIAYLEAGHQVVDQSDRLFAIWDGKPSRGVGGTADIVEYAERKGTPVTVIWPKGLSR